MTHLKWRHSLSNCRHCWRLEGLRLGRTADDSLTPQQGMTRSHPTAYTPSLSPFITTLPSPVQQTQSLVGYDSSLLKKNPKQTNPNQLKTHYKIKRRKMRKRRKRQVQALFLEDTWLFSYCPLFIPCTFMWGSIAFLRDSLQPVLHCLMFRDLLLLLLWLGFPRAESICTGFWWGHWAWI